VGLTGNCNTLILAMSFAAPGVVSALLEAGINVDNSVDRIGNHAFEYAASLSRVENLRLWMERIPDWDINRPNTFIGGTVLNLALLMGNGCSSYETAKFLLDNGLLLEKSVMHGGATALMNAAQNESINPNVLKLILDHGAKLDARKRPQTLKFKIIKGIMRFILKYRISKSEILRVLTDFHNASAIFMAVARGDTEVVRLLLDRGASVHLKNADGDDVIRFCNVRGPFPRIMRLLLKAKEKN